jgi:hypothetical protein
MAFLVKSISIIQIQSKKIHTLERASHVILECLRKYFCMKLVSLGTDRKYLGCNVSVRYRRALCLRTQFHALKHESWRRELQRLALFWLRTCLSHVFGRI